ncbi:hypothetical protein BN2476_300099 [Paraburkholderia piptadeniae]|uniref:Uncharacterized protein n=1 Tax=Paraburkholderia piptadeniae TaxID=1701573 RepID=A0A1N7S2S0_9BURK|nr:hypothetical protein BN2476_300099 [Paraburkholderia piptadeniae]
MRLERHSRTAILYRRGRRVHGRHYLIVRRSEYDHPLGPSTVADSTFFTFVTLTVGPMPFQ